METHRAVEYMMRYAVREDSKSYKQPAFSRNYAKGRRKSLRLLGKTKETVTKFGRNRAYSGFAALARLPGLTVAVDHRL